MGTAVREHTSKRGAGGGWRKLSRQIWEERAGELVTERGRGANSHGANEGDGGVLYKGAGRRDPGPHT